MWLDKRADELLAGDTLLTSGAVVEQTVLCGHGESVYIRAVFEDGYTQVATVPADRIIPVFIPDAESEAQ